MTSSPLTYPAIELSYDSTNTIEEFQVEFQVQYFTIGESDSESNSDEMGKLFSNQQSSLVINN